MRKLSKYRQNLGWLIVLLLSTPPIFAQNINYLEYFIGNDPGYKNGISVPVTIGQTVDMNFTIDLSSNLIPFGTNLLGIRARDDNYKWSMTYLSSLYKQMIPVDTLADIVRIEYFFDFDPGYGNGIPFSFSQGPILNDLAFVTIIPNSLLDGFHSLMIRVQDNNGKWGTVVTRTFFKNKIKPDLQLAHINRLEYFFDDDPGYGNGTEVPITKGTHLDEFTFEVPLTTVSTGVHRFSVRVQDGNGKWSEVYYTLVSRFDEESPLAEIVRMEYFIDVDPGYGNGSFISLDPDTQIDDLNFMAEVGSKPAGEHFLEVRAQDANGKWSTVAIKKVTVCDDPFKTAISPAGDQVICSGTSVTLSVDNGYYYQWRKDGADMYNQSQSSLTVNQSGVYTVVVANENCVFTTEPVRVTVVPNLSPPTVETPNKTICKGESATIVATGCSGEFHWNNGSVGQAISVSPEITTTYKATCKTADCESNESSTFCTITVNPPVSAPTVNGPANPVCPGSTQTLTASGCSGTITWNTGETGSSITVIAKVEKSYYATCKEASCTSGQSNVYHLQLNNSTAYSMILIAGKNEICFGESTSLTASGCLGTILWSTSETTPTINVSPTANTVYTATCTHLGCTGSSANNILVQVNQTPVAPVIINSNSTIINGESITLTATSCVGGEVIWNDGGRGAQRTVAPIVNTTYSAVCQKDGCSGLSSNEVTITVLQQENPSVNIVKIEYFIDQDPGYGNGTDVPVTPASYLLDFNFPVPLSESMGLGPHLLTVRIKDSHEQWSQSYTNSFWLDKIPDYALKDITKLEYFIDDDPGYGQGEDVPFTHDKNIDNFIFPVTIPEDLSNGFHRISFRSRNSIGDWSTVSIKQFFKENETITDTLPEIVKLEYFIDEDPGYGNGTDIPLTPDIEINGIPLSINMTGLALGQHFLEVRAKDSNGKWSIVGIQTFSHNENLITVVSLAANQCGGAVVEIPYTLDGTFDNANNLTVQLLNMNNQVVYGNLVTENRTVSGTLTATLPNPNQTTSYKLRIISSNPSVNSETVEIKVFNTVKPIIVKGGDNTFCWGNSVLLSVNNCPGEVTWSNGKTGNMMSVIHSGTYKAYCSTPGTNCSVESDPMSVTVKGETEITGNLHLCGTNSNTTLEATGCQNGQVNWFTQETGGTAVATNTMTYTTPTLVTTTTYYVECHIDQCESPRFPVTVEVFPIPTAPVITAFGQTTICSAQNVKLSAGNCLGTITWSNGSNENTITVSPASTTVYKATCTVNGCTSGYSNSITVTIVEECIYPVEITPARPYICPGTSVTMKASGCPSNYQWTGGHIGNTLTVSPVTTTTYTATCLAGGSKTVTVTVNASSVVLTGTDDIDTGTVKYQVSQQISSKARIGNETNPKPNVSYEAGKAIILEPGFKVEAGSVFLATIKTCN